MENIAQQSFTTKSPITRNPSGESVIRRFLGETRLAISDNCLVHRSYFLALLDLVCVFYDIQNKNSGRRPTLVDHSDQGSSQERRTCFLLVPACPRLYSGQAFWLAVSATHIQPCCVC